MSARARLNSPAGLVGLIFPATVAVMTPFLSPVIIGGLVDAAGYSERDAALIVAAETNAFAWAGLAGVLWLNRLSWRLVSLTACAIFVIANVGSCFAPPGALTTLRVISGSAAGSLIALCYGALAQGGSPHRTYAYFSMSQMALAMVCLTVLPVAIRLDPESASAVASMLRFLGVESGYGINAFFGALAGLGVLATVCALFWVPQRPPLPPVKSVEASGGVTPVKWLLAGAMLVAIFTLMVSHQSMWTFAERIGVASGISPASTGIALSLGTLAGFLGASSAAATGNRLRRSYVIIAIFALHIAALAVFLLDLSLLLFTLGIVLHKFAWNFMIPYQLGMVAEIDRRGIAAIFSTFVTSLGVSTGAGVAGLVVPLHGYDGVILTAMAVACIYLVVMLAVAARLMAREATMPAENLEKEQPANA